MTGQALIRRRAAASWRGPFGPVEFGGVRYGLKCHEFCKVPALPGRTGRPFEIALNIHPGDWEMAAVGPGLTDLAGLTSGGWTRAQKDTMALTCHRALPEGLPAKADWHRFLDDLEHCRLAQAVQWTPPPEHAQNWLNEAVVSAEILQL